MRKSKKNKRNKYKKTINYHNEESAFLNYTPQFREKASKDNNIIDDNDNAAPFINISNSNKNVRNEEEDLASQDEIRKAYKKLILINHPDKGGNAEKFNKIHEAYEMLSNPITKNIIDTFGSMSLDLVKSILISDILSSKQFIDDINFCIKQKDYTQLFFLVNNIRT